MFLCLYICMTQHVTSGFGNALLRLSDMLDFEINKNNVESIRNFIPHFFIDSILLLVSTNKILFIILYCVIANKISLCYVMLYRSVTDSTLN